MAWLAVDPSATREAPIDDSPDSPRFVFGFWPPAKAERLKSYPFLKAEEKSDEETFRVGWDMVRYGIRGWSGLVNGEGTPVEPKVGTEKVAGREVPVLSDESIEMLHASQMFVPLALLCLQMNTLKEDQKKTSGLRLDFSTPTQATADAETAGPSGKT